MKKKYNYKVLSINLDREDLAKLENLAKVLGLNRSKTVAYLLRFFLELNRPK
jgi:hypothetical protein